MHTLTQFGRRLVSNSLTTKEHSILLLATYLVGLSAFVIGLLLVHRIPGDDLVFQDQIKPFTTLPDWIVYRYGTWSGRIFAESFVYIFSPLPLVFWKIASLTIFATYSGILFKYYTLFASKRSQLKDFIMLALVLLLPLLMDTHVLIDGMLWVTGSMNYFWLATFGIIGFYPFCYYLVRDKLPHWLICVVSSIAILIAASSQEQVGAVIVTLATLLVGYFMYRQKRYAAPVYLIAVTLLAIAAFIFTINAPGNHMRVEAETALRLPDFYTVPMVDRIEYSYRWFIDSVINHFGLLLAAYWALLLGLFYRKSKYTRLDLAIIGMLVISAIVLFLKGFSSVAYWFNFYPTWNVSAPVVSIATMLPWTFAIIASVAAPLILFRRRAFGVLIALLFCAALATTAIITLSPSMYASGVRTLYIPSVLMVITVYILFDKLYDKQKKAAAAALTVILTIGLSQYIQVIQNSF